ncbi:hypothetical protein GQ54DRAFT_127585 [Martensiomyces pterosporus]|nr:hypothetical protein GQ54DRAFT_127585 [Martensiomyces pterosporus]
MERGFVAASCLDYIGAQQNTGTTYKVFLSNSQGQQKQAAVIKIHLHPSYSPDTLANNIAVIELSGTNTSDEIGTPIAMDRSSWTSIAYTRKLLLDVESLQWGQLSIESHFQSDDHCAAMSNLYFANSNDLLCGGWAQNTTYDTHTCGIPFGIAYAKSSKYVSAAAIYSHTASSGNSPCDVNGENQLSYYTILTNYVSFAESVLRRAVNKSIADDRFKPNNDPGYKMALPQAMSIDGVTVYGGDWSQNAISRLLATTDPSSSSPTTASSSSDTSAITSSASSDDSAQSPSPTASASQDNTSGLTKGQTIGFAVGIPVAVAIVGAGLFYLLKWQKTKRAALLSKTPGPSSEEKSLGTHSTTETRNRKTARQSLPLIFRKYYSRRTIRLEPSDASSKVLI